jgi:cell wall-associated NlpC family hydrolase
MDRLIAPLSDEQRRGVIAAARSFIGAPFRHRGRLPTGMDCLGLVVLSMRAVGVEMHDRRAYGRDPVADGIAIAARAHFGDPIPLDTLTPGDLVLMRWHKRPNHVAIVTDYPLGGLALIHSLLEAGHVVEHRLSDPWPRRIYEGFRP